MPLVRVAAQLGDKDDVGEEVTVRLGGLVADIFSDADGLVPLANPLEISGNGYVVFYAEVGTYTLESAVGNTTVEASVDGGLGGGGISEAELDAGLSTKQDAATAATDAELAAAVAGVDLSSKQDAATAATDAELASGLTAKQDAATAATDAELAAAQAADDTRLDTLEAAPAGEASPFTDAGVIISSDDTQASWVVGSDRMDRDAADSTKDKRAWFNKIKAAFRAGTATAAQWDNANVGDYSVAIGLNCTASGLGSVAFGHTNTASGGQAHAEGYNNTASGSTSHAEGMANTASANYSHAEGQGNTASGNGAHVEGQNNTASGSSSHAEGLYASAPRATQYAKASGRFAASGDAQMGNMVVRQSTTDATPTVLAAGAVNLAGGDTNVLTVLASRAYTLKISAVARRTDVQGEMAGWTWEGLVGRDSTGSARIIGTPTATEWSDAAAAPWNVAVSINTTDATNNYVAVTATGEAAKTIRWVAKMEWVEVAG